MPWEFVFHFVLNMAVSDFRSAKLLSDVNYIQTRVSLDWRKWHLFLDSSFTDLKSDTAMFSTNWKTNSNGIGLAYSF